MVSKPGSSVQNVPDSVKEANLYPCDDIINEPLNRLETVPVPEIQDEDSEMHSTEADTPLQAADEPKHEPDDDRACDNDNIDKEGSGKFVLLLKGLGQPIRIFNPWRKTGAGHKDTGLGVQMWLLAQWHDFTKVK